ncbi:MAG: iron-sulfur cluster assembly accessory protein [Alphaproteobacteria bacterium]|jgi:iron-sulfur cluster assembly protein
MEKPPILTMTGAAVSRAKELMNRGGGEVLALRVGVKTGGCSGLMYEVEYATEKKPFEEVVETAGVKVFINPTAIMFLLGSEMDYKTDKFQSTFVFNNPNETDRCGCGESFRVA